MSRSQRTSGRENEGTKNKETRESRKEGVQRRDAEGPLRFEEGEMPTCEDGLFKQEGRVQ